MTNCTCTDIKRLIMCELERGDGPCLTSKEPAPEPPALNSDALTNTIVAKLGATITHNFEGN